MLSNQQQVFKRSIFNLILNGIFIKISKTKKEYNEEKIYDRFFYQKNKRRQKTRFCTTIVIGNHENTFLACFCWNVCPEDSSKLTCVLREKFGRDDSLVESIFRNRVIFA